MQMWVKILLRVTAPSVQARQRKQWRIYSHKQANADAAHICGVAICKYISAVSQGVPQCTCPSGENPEEVVCRNYTIVLT
jgi:hypothetical protein